MRPSEAETVGSSSTWKRCPKKKARYPGTLPTPGNGATRPLLTILGGASTRMTNRTSQQFSPQFCGRTRRLMHTCRFSRDLEVQLAGTGEGTQHTVATLGRGSPPGVPNVDPPPMTSVREKKRPNGTECSHPLPPNWVRQPLQGHGMPSSKVTCREAKCGGNSHDTEP